MKNRAFLISTVAVALLAASPTASSAAARGWILPEAKNAKEMLYVSGISGYIDIFAFSHGAFQLVGQIADNNGPDGLHVDPQGNLYVADEGIGSEGPGAGDILVFPKGSTAPSREIVAGYNVSDALLGVNGDIYASNYGPDGQFGPGSMSVFGPSGDRPLRTTRIPGAFQALSLTMDPATSDTFVTYSTSAGYGRIARFKHGAGKPIDLGVSFGSPWGIAEDGSGNLLVCDGNDGEVHVYTQAGKLLGSFTVPGTPYRLAFNRDRSRLYITNFYNYDVEIFTYPGVKIVGSIHASDWSKQAWPDGIAVWPAP